MLPLLIGPPSLLLGACAPALTDDGVSAEETPGARSESAAPGSDDVADDGSQPRIVATTPIIADLVRAVAPRARIATIWLGLRVDGRASTDSTVSFEAVSATGPGDLAAFTTGTFGEPRPWIASKDGIDSNNRVELPSNAHTHMSWGFTDPGVYSLSLRATLRSVRRPSSSPSASTRTPPGGASSTPGTPISQRSLRAR